jgi:hypothetical protein
LVLVKGARETEAIILYWCWCILVRLWLFLVADLPSGCLVLGLAGYTIPASWQAYDDMFRLHDEIEELWI